MGMEQDGYFVEDRFVGTDLEGGHSPAAPEVCEGLQDVPPLPSQPPRLSGLRRKLSARSSTAFSGPSPSLASRMPATSGLSESHVHVNKSTGMSTFDAESGGTEVPPMGGMGSVGVVRTQHIAMQLADLFLEIRGIQDMVEASKAAGMDAQKHAPASDVGTAGVSVSRVFFPLSAGEQFQRQMDQLRNVISQHYGLSETVSFCVCSSWAPFLCCQQEL